MSVKKRIKTKLIMNADFHPGLDWSLELCEYCRLPVADCIEFETDSRMLPVV